MKNALFIFRRDFRLDDNTALLKACQESQKVYLAFIFNPEQVSSQNSYRSLACINFMIESLTELSQEIKEKRGKLNVFYGDTLKVISSIVKKIKAEAIYFNQDYTAFAVKRDSEIEKWGKKHKIPVFSLADVTLNHPSKTTKKDGDPYSIFTPFYKNASKIKVNSPVNFPKSKFDFGGDIDISLATTLSKMKKYGKAPPELEIKAGRKAALKILKNIDDHKKYNSTRNLPIINTTRLSAHLKFGTISCREAYATFKKKLNSSNDLIKQLYWRDFYLSVQYYFPDLKKSNTRDKMNKIKWKSSSKNFKAWKEGKTGIPLVDAGMREMNATGFMHNRVRMVVATFLIFNLGIDWRKGEKYFSQKLIDIDVANNNGNWKWVAGIESFSNDWFKAMNVYSQTQRFDPEGEYIKKWCPELKDVPGKHLQKWEKYHEEYSSKIKYPEPIVDVKETRKGMLKVYKKYT